MKNRAIVGAIAIGVAVLAAALLPILASAGADQVRDIRLAVRGMTFYEDGRSEPNPMLVLRAGEKVRILVRNEDAGMQHDFAVEAWSIRSRLLEDRGEQDALVFRVPDERGTQTYHCTPHPRMMSGTLRIE